MGNQEPCWDEKPGLVAVEGMLPALDGFEVCHRLRAEPETVRLPILMLSAKAREVDIDTGRRVGADIYLTKPLDPSALVVQVSTLLQEERRDV
jgi:DNA-binding response OmpR family regulator